MISMRRIQEYADRVARQFQPERIILFGSYAYGTPDEDSDVDLLVYDPAYLVQRATMEDWFVREVLEKRQTLFESRHAGVG